MSKIEDFIGLTDDSAAGFIDEGAVNNKKENIDKTETVSNSLGLGKNKLGRKKTTITVSMETYNKLITLSVMHGETISDVAEKALDKSLKGVKINEEYVQAFNNNGGKKRRDRVKATIQQVTKQNQE